MNSLGHTRSSYQRDHLLQTPDTFIRAALPGMERGTAIVHTGPTVGAKFVQYTAELESDGLLGPAETQRFVYVLDGKISAAVQKSEHVLQKGGFIYLPEKMSHRITALSQSRLLVIEKPYLRLAHLDPPEYFAGCENEIESRPLMGDPWLQVRMLVPDNESFDFAVNTMTFQPGASLALVEMHVMEHGLLMLEGAGIYRLGEHWYPVQAGDFIWMAPYCPQWFGALGKSPSRYIIYKDWNRHAVR